MIIHNLYVPCILAIPAKTNSELVIDPNAPLAFPIAFQLLQAIPRRILQVFDGTGKIKGLKPPYRRSSDASPSPAAAGEEERASFRISEGLNHA